MHDIIEGGLLGDSNLEYSGKSTRLKIERSIKDLKYLEWEYSKFKEFCISGIKIYDRYDKRYNKTHTYCYFRTRSLEYFNSYYFRWYKERKIVPEDLELNSMVIARWFADDGNIIKYNKKAYVTKFSTESFTLEEIEFLVKKLKDFVGEKFSKVKRKDKFVIRGYAKASIKLSEIIREGLLSMGMERKVLKNEC